MEGNKILSISVAAYNVEATLKETLEPFVNCGVLEALDIMIVDDGSKDGTATLAREYADKYPDSIRLISKENGGWGSTVNRGIAEARGKYFRQVDGDDYYQPDNMPAYIEALRECEADLVVTPYLTFDATTGEVITHENCNPGCLSGQLYHLDEIPSFGPFMHSIAVKTSCLKDRVTITEHCFYTDTEFVLKACNQVETVMFLEMEIYCYRRASVGQSMSLAGLEKHYGEQTKVIEVLLEYLHKEVQRDSVRKIYDKLLFGTCWWQYLVLLYIQPNRQHKKDLMYFDSMLRERSPQYYKQITLPGIVFLRKTGFWGYSWVARRQKKKDNRFTDDGRLIN